MYMILFVFSNILGTIISTSSCTWLGMWIGLEINLLSIIPLMNNNKNPFSSEASLKYFITQAIASSILLFSIILMSMNFYINFFYENSLMMIFNSALLTKMGMAPFHFWLPMVMEGLSWSLCFMIATISKFAPLILLSYNFNYPVFFSMTIILGSMIGGILGFNQTSIRKLMAYSSIIHMSWMMSSMFSHSTIFMLYFIIYTITSMNIMGLFWYLNIFLFKDLIPKINNLFLKFTLTINFLSLGGLPPFIGFIPKWLTIEYLLMNYNFWLPMIMVIMTILSMAYYMRMIYFSFMINPWKMNYSINYNYSNFYMTLFLTLNISLTLSFMICLNLLNFL
uniref:NADH-ubiquinone oxidoreductase chain 2 n=1 Tax=Staphylinidae sp. BMNH 1274706 TaxID=1796599 RepID=A0A140EG19_9COLE|nr:NADH dehydrogenase subunit 2 [Staphylinidae sp. BMNH 1274706]